MRILARIISDIFNPVVLLFPLPYLLLLRSTTDAMYSFRWAFLSWLFLILFGVLVIYLVRKRIFSDLDVSKREERPLLFLLASVLTIAYSFCVFLLNGPQVLMVTALGILVGLLMLNLINSRIKASIHVATVSALLFTIGIVYSGIYLGLLLLIPVVAWARVITHRHTVSEVVIGSIFGSLLTLLMYILVKLVFVM